MKNPLLPFVLLAVSLVSMTGLATNALLVAHLDCCHGHTDGACSPAPDAPPPPEHDHANCLFCQFFLGVGGKYLTPPTDVLVFNKTVVICRDFFISHLYSQAPLLAAVPRGPPVA